MGPLADPPGERATALRAGEADPGWFDPGIHGPAQVAVFEEAVREAVRLYERLHFSLDELAYLYPDDPIFEATDLLALVEFLYSQ